MAYFEHPDYVPLLRLAERGWRDFEAASGESLLTQIGIVEAGYAGAPMVEGSLQSAVQHGLPHEVLTSAQVNARFPAFSLPPGWDCVFQPEGGVLRPEKAIRLYARAAEELGAEVALHTAVTEVHPVGDRVELVLGSGQVIEAGSVIIAAGPWLKTLVPELGSHMRLTRQCLTWFTPVERALVRPDRMPVFMLQAEDDLIYGLPDVCGTGVKAASHLEGERLDSAEAPRAEPTEAELSALRTTLARYVPAAAGAVSQTTACVYTRSPDEHFVLGLHPRAPQVVLASPCSGHGFKFTSAFGDILADLALKRATAAPIDLFSPVRLLGRGAAG